MAKREKAKLRGRAGDQYREDNVGNVLAVSWQINFYILTLRYKAPNEIGNH